MLPIISGQGIPDTLAYNPNESGPHHVLLLTTSGIAYNDWNVKLPYEWSPSSVSETELVVLIGLEREITLGSRSYNIGPDITAYRYDLDLELREAHSGQTLATATILGPDPRPFPMRTAYDQTRLEGHVVYEDLEEWLCSIVTGQDCWMRLSTPERDEDSEYLPTYSPDWQIFARVSSLDNSVVQLWQVSDGSLLHTLQGDPAEVNRVAFSPDGKTLAPESWDRIVSLWQVSDGILLRRLEGFTGVSTSMAFSPDGKILAIGPHEGKVLLWQVSDGTLLRKLEVGGGSVNSLDFSLDGKTLVSRSEPGGLSIVRLWRVSDGILLQNLDGIQVTLAFSPDGQTLSWSSNDLLRLYRVSDGTLLFNLKNVANVISMAFSPDGQTLASGTSVGTLNLYRVSGNAWFHILAGHAGSVTSVAFSPDGQIVAMGTFDGPLSLWQVSDGTLLHILTGHKEAVSNMVFSPDGQTLASGSEDDTVRLWRVTDGALLRTLEGTSVVFSSDGQTLVVRGWDSAFSAYTLVLRYSR